MQKKQKTETSLVQNTLRKLEAVSVHLRKSKQQNQIKARRNLQKSLQDQDTSDCTPEKTIFSPPLETRKFILQDFKV